jgi:tetratricopeptide (TPR) repeat protein
MKRLAALGFALVAVSVGPAIAQVQNRSEIDLPEWEWIVPLTSPVMFQREGEIAPEETPFWREFWPLLRDAQYDEALRLFRQNFAVPDDMEKGIVHSPALDSDDVSAALFYLLGQTYFRLERNPPAETAFKSALNYLPDYTRVHESLGYLYLGEERYDEAREHLSRAAALGLNTAALYGSLGFLNQATDNPWGAVSAYQQAMALDGDNEQWQRGLLNALNSSRNYGSAFALVEELLDVHPDDADLWVYRAFLSQRTGDDASALASLETAIRLGEDSEANLQVCATLHMQIGSVARATELLGRGFVGGMDYLYVDQALVWLMREGEWAYAGQLIETARTEAGDLRDVQRSRFLTREASIAEHNGESDLARERLDEALELDASNADALMELAALYRSRGDYGQAELFYQRASAFEEHRESAALSLAQLAIDQNQYQRALDLLRDIVQQNPLRGDLRRNIEILENLVDLGSGA